MDIGLHSWSGHISDIVLSHGFAVSDIELSYFLLSDHKPILISMSLPNLSHFTKKALTLSRSYSTKFGSNLNQCFMESCSHLSLDIPLSGAGFTKIILRNKLRNCLRYIPQSS